MMTYVIAEPCLNVKDKSCAEVCPMDCIGENPDGSSPQLYINPNECIACGLCEPACPVGAIFEAAELPEEWQHYEKINADFFE